MSVSERKKSFTQLSFNTGFNKPCWFKDLITEFNEAVTLYILYSCETKKNRLQTSFHLLNKGSFLSNVSNVTVLVTLNESTMENKLSLRI